MDPLDRRQAVEYLLRHSEASLETFFDSVGLGEAFRRPKSGYGREKRINEALREVEIRGDDVASVFATAYEWFGHERPEWRHAPELLREVPAPAGERYGEVASNEKTSPPRYVDHPSHQWATQHQDFLEIVYDEFDRDGDWPERPILQRRLIREGARLDLGRLAAELRPHLGHIEAPPEERIVLRLPALRYLEQAQGLLETFVEVVKIAVHRYLSEEDDLVLGRRDLIETLGLSDAEATKLSRVLLREARFLGSGTTEVTHWERQIYDSGLVPFLDVADIDEYLAVEARLLQWHPAGAPAASAIVNEELPRGRGVFLVHGHDDAAKQSVARFLERIMDPDVVVLEEQPDRGRTIIEKFEEYAGDAGYAVVPHVRLGKYVRYDPEDLERWIATVKRGPK